MEIRNFQEDDVKAVIALFKGFENEVFVERSSIYWMFWKFFRNTCFIAVDDNKVIGVLLGLIDQTTGEYGFVHELGVAETHRGQGIATKLIDKFGKVVKEAGGHKVCLNTVKENENAIRFYENRGFDERKDFLKVGQERIWFCKKV